MTIAMPQPDLSHLETLAKAATPRGTSLDETPIMPYSKADVAYASADHRFIAACSPDVLLALIARVRKLEKALELYGQHDDDCPCVGEVAPHSLECKDCDCGLNATFTSLEAPDA